MNRALTILIIVCLALLACTGWCQETTPPSSPLHVVADSMTYDIPTQGFTAEGNVHITYDDTTLDADHVTGDSATGDVQASGHVHFVSKDRSLTADTFAYNFHTEVGDALNIVASVDHIYFTGQELKSSPSKYTVLDSRVTGCDLANPHYYLYAKELTIEPNERLTAKHVGVVIFGHRLITLPRYSRSLVPGAQSTLRLPLVGVSDKYGVFARYEFDLSDRPSTLAGLQLGVSTKQAFQTGLMYDRIAGYPVFARLAYRLPYAGGSHPGVYVTRLPEIGIRSSAGRSAGSLALTRDAIDRFAGFPSTLSSRIVPGQFNHVAEVGYGYFIETPSHEKASRVDGRVVAWLPLSIGPGTLISPGVSGRLSHYSTGDDYSSFGLRMAVSHRFSPDTALEVGYTTRSVHGSTPFAFDAVDLRSELNLITQFTLFGFQLGLQNRYNVKDGKLFDTEVSVSRVMHCVEPSITYHKRTGQVAVGLRMTNL